MIRIRDHNLPRWETHNTYDVYFDTDSIRTTVTHDPAKVSEWISDVKSLYRHHHSRIVGLDVEWRPHNHGNPVATIQLCVDRRCLIYKILHSPYIPHPLADFLSDYGNVFVGVSIKPDLQKLQNDHGVGGNAHYVKLGWRAAEVYDRRDLKNAGLKALASLVLGKEMEKPREVTMSGWDNERLTAAQVQYACVDAFVSYEIGRVLHFSYS